MNGYAREKRDLPRPVDINRAVEEAAKKLSALGDEYALIGGVALSVYGIERYTKDVDFAATVAQTGKAEAALTADDPKPLRIGGISISTSVDVRVDLIDRRFQYRALFEEAIEQAKRRGPLAVAGVAEVPVVPLSYLVAMKLIADRPQDEADLQKLLRANELDYAGARDVVFRHVGDYAARRLDKLARAVQRTDVPKDYETEGDS